jgi:hypothetical protein
MSIPTDRDYLLNVEFVDDEVIASIEKFLFEITFDEELWKKLELRKKWDKVRVMKFDGASISEIQEKTGLPAEEIEKF